MTARQLENCVLLRDLKKPVELISIQAELPVESVKRWLRSGAGKALQLSLFDRDGWSPRPETTQPVATNERDHGLRIFSWVV